MNCLTGQILRSLVAPSKEGPADEYIYIYIYMYIHVCIHMHGSQYLKGFAPCRRPLNSGFDDTTIRCFDGLLTASHLCPIGGSRACLLMSILIPFEVHFGCRGWPWTSCWRPLEMPRAWPGSRTGPGTPEWAGLHSRPGGSTVLLGSRDGGNRPSRGWI